MKVTRNDPTPNPDAIKFVLDGHIVAAGSRSFRDRLLCEDPIAKQLFAVEEVVSIFFVANVITVTKDPFADWSVLIPRLNQVLEEATKDFEPLNSSPLSPFAGRTVTGDHDAQFLERSHEEKVSKINTVFDEAVRPGLASDGGGLHLVDVDGKVVRVQYQGACGSCPSATSGTLYYIESVLRSRVHPDLEVELV
jgi:Fe-S cluster biogenesis protein NfuA